MSVTDSAGTVASQPITLTIPSTKTPPDGSPLTFTATGSTTIPAIAHTGNATIKVTAASTTLDPKDANGRAEPEPDQQHHARHDQRDLLSTDVSPAADAGSTSERNSSVATRTGSRIVIG